MSPPESKTSSNPNRVRCFKKSALVQATASEKWELVKVICTQPFNEQVQYGLSSIKLYISGDETPSKSSTKESSEKEKPKIVAGKFKLRDDSPDSENDAMGLFNRWKTSKSEKSSDVKEVSKKQESSTSKPKRGETSSSSSKGRPSEKNGNNDDEKRTKVVDKKRLDSLFGEDEEEKQEEKKVEDPKKEIDFKGTPSGSKRPSTSNLESESCKKVKYESFSSSDDESNATKSPKKKKTTNTPGTSKKKSPEKPYLNSFYINKTTGQRVYEKSRTIYKPFNKLLEGVTIVISGIQVRVFQWLRINLKKTFLSRTQLERKSEERHWN